MAALAPNPTQISLPPTPHHVLDRTLKRSASTASLLSPPASVRKPRASKRLRSAVDSEDDSDVGGGDYLWHERPIANRPKTRSMKSKAVTGTVLAPVVPVVQKRINFVEPPSKEEQRDAHSVGARPMTPPPCVCVPTASLPQTPPRTTTRRGGRISRDAPERDSPNNPFLVECLGSPVLRVRPVRRATDFTEAPTVGYVFRGVPTTFANPYANQHPPSPTLEPNHPSFLPLDHPDFSPSELTRPLLLFPEAHGYLREGSSPCPRFPPSTPKRGRAKAPRTPTRKSKCNAREEPMTGVEQDTEMEAEMTGPETPEPKTPPRRTRTRTTASTVGVDAEVSRRVTRSKTTAETRK